MTIHEFIEQHPYLLWYTKNYSDLSEEAVIEAILNYGDFDDVRALLALLGIKRVATIFRKQMERKRNNYDPKIAHYFKLYFARHA